jgi:undecaprenyl-diphosphatase
MKWFEALILGIIQGLTEFLPVSSDGHLAIGWKLLGVISTESLLFTVIVHGATVLSTIVVFWRDIILLLSDLFSFKWNDSTKYSLKLILSMIPVVIVGLFFKDLVEGLFDANNMIFVGAMLIITGLMLASTNKIKPGDKSVTFWGSFIIGIAQAIAVLPGVSRSALTISTGIFLKVKKEQIAKFSFLMAILPIIGANMMELFDTNLSATKTDFSSLAIGFLAAFFTGLFACKWMVSIVRKQKLIYFAIYCFLVGIAVIVYTFLNN